MKTKGILLDDNSDLLITNESLVIGDVTSQNQKNLILIEKTELKATPMRGVGAKRFLESNSPDVFAREIRQEFSIDGMKVQAIKIGANAQIEVNAFYL